MDSNFSTYKPVMIDDNVYWFLELCAQRPNSATCHVRIPRALTPTPLKVTICSGRYDMEHIEVRKFVFEDSFQWHTDIQGCDPCRGDDPVVNGINVNKRVSQISIISVQRV